MGPRLLLALCSLATSAASAQTSVLNPALSPSADLRTPYERTVPRADVSLRGNVGEETIDVVATRVQIDALLRQIAVKSHRELMGLESLNQVPNVTTKLQDTDLRDALRWIGGSVGLSITVTTSAIKVAEDLPAYPTRSDLYERAGAGYFRALVDHPESVMAPGASWNRARIEESSPERALEAARAFDAIVDGYPKSDLLPDALLRAGKLFGEAEAWEEAAVRFDRLAGLPTPHNHSIEARRRLAAAHTYIAEAATSEAVARESARRALLVLDALDDFEESQDPEDRRERYIVRSRAHSLNGEPVEAMRCLDLATSYSRHGERDPELSRLRAMAFERAERYADAVRAWLFHASLLQGEERQESYVRAASASNRGREYLATMAIAKAAANEGFQDALMPYSDAALIALDMEPKRIDLFGDVERIARGARLAGRGLHKEAVEALRPVFERSGTLDREQRIELARALAGALLDKKNTERNVEEALLVLRQTASSLTRLRDREDLYRFAATRLEKAGEFEAAIAALEGRL